MEREKKITVKPFLNKRLKSKQIALGGGKLYPLYFQVIYDQKTTRFQAGSNWFSIGDEGSLKDNLVIAKTIQAIKKIVRYEADRIENFEIKGIGDRIKSYSTEMGIACKLSLSEQVSNHLKQKMSYSKFEEWDKKNVEDKIELGLIYLGNKAPESLARLFLLSSLIGDFAPNGLTVFSWLLTDEREVITSNIQKFIESKKGDNLVVVTKNGTKFAYQYSLNLQPTIAGFDMVAHQIIDANIHFIPDFKSVSYDEVEEVFRLTLKKK